MEGRSRKRGHPRLLLVEGADDRRLVPELVELGCGLEWERGGQPIVYVQEKGGIEAMLLRGAIAAELLESSRQALGMIIDADDRPQERWSSIRELLLADVVDLEPASVPQDPPANGFIAEVDRTAPGGARRLGVWMMPDNRSSGMMETFVRSFISEGELCGLAERSCDEATRLGAKYKRVHRDKAVVHTWLAWQDPPGRQLHDAIKQRMLDPGFPPGQAFMQWFRALFRV
jgi:hypothetical protein